MHVLFVSNQQSQDNNSNFAVCWLIQNKNALTIPDKTTINTAPIAEITCCATPLISIHSDQIPRSNATCSPEKHTNATLSNSAQCPHVYTAVQTSRNPAHSQLPLSCVGHDISHNQLYFRLRLPLKTWSEECADAAKRKLRSHFWIGSHDKRKNV